MRVTSRTASDEGPCAPMKSTSANLYCAYHQTRLEFDARRETLWRCLYEYYFRRWIPDDGCVLDLGAGYGHFINNVKARRRIAIDLWCDTSKYIGKGVECRVGDVRDLSFLHDGEVNFAFASNLFEHLSKDDLGSILRQLLTKLSDDGVLCIIQPNYRYAYREYFDDYTHVTVYSHVTLCDFLAASGYEIVLCKPKFMPLTIKSRFKVLPLLIRLYLQSPIKPFGKQMLIIARRSRPGGQV
jgi:SAM-dependent methyltransferase